MRVFSLLVVVADGIMLGTREFPKSLNDHGRAELVEIQSAADFADPHDTSSTQRRMSAQKVVERRLREKTTVPKRDVGDDAKPKGAAEEEVSKADSDKGSEKDSNVENSSDKETDKDSKNQEVPHDDKVKKMTETFEAMTTAKSKSDVDVIIESRAAMIEIQTNMAAVMAKATGVKSPSYKKEANKEFSGITDKKSTDSAKSKPSDKKVTALLGAIEVWQAFRENDLFPKQDDFHKTKVPAFETAINEVRNKMIELDRKAGWGSSEENDATAQESTIRDTLSRLPEQSITNLVEEYQSLAKQMAQESTNAIKNFNHATDAVIALQKEEAAKWKAARQAVKDLEASAAGTKEAQAALHQLETARP